MERPSPESGPIGLQTVRSGAPRTAIPETPRGQIPQGRATSKRAAVTRGVEEGGAGAVSKLKNLVRTDADGPTLGTAERSRL